MSKGRYSGISGAFECLGTTYPGSRHAAIPSELCRFFAKLHPVARIEDSLQVAQLIEYGYNAFTMMDTGAVYLTVGDADTYAAWYLQRVFGIRNDVLVISLPYLIAPEYRSELVRDKTFERVFGKLPESSLPLPPTTADTDSSRDSLVAMWKHSTRKAPIYFSPSCALGLSGDTNLVSVGLVFSYESPPRTSRQIYSQLLDKMKKEWQLSEASRGMPEAQLAIRNCTIQYLTMAMIEGSQMHRDGDTTMLVEFFQILDPVCSANWQFNMARYSLCTEAAEQCSSYLQRIKDYAASHPDDNMARRFLDGLDGK
ncbi:MAG: hypothetical protein WBP29_10835 [Candidatus Zixiibacteriota bacterium]